MTLKLVIKNEGNQPEDAAIIKGVYDIGEGHVELTGDLEDQVCLMQGEEVAVVPPCGHFDDFKQISIKGKH